MSYNKAMGPKFSNTFRACEACTLGKAKKAGISKPAVSKSKNKGERLFFNITSPSTVSFGGKKHLLQKGQTISTMDVPDGRTSKLREEHITQNTIGKFEQLLVNLSDQRTNNEY